MITRRSKGYLGDDAISALIPPAGTALLSRADMPGRRRTFPATVSALPNGTRGRKPLSAQTARAVSGAKPQASAYDQRHAPCPRLARPLVRLAASVGHCPT